jgi:hypothetical protein
MDTGKSLQQIKPNVIATISGQSLAPYYKFSSSKAKAESNHGMKILTFNGLFLNQLMYAESLSAQLNPGFAPPYYPTSSKA